MANFFALFPFLFAVPSELLVLSTIENLFVKIGYSIGILFTILMFLLVSKKL